MTAQAAEAVHELLAEYREPAGGDREPEDDGDAEV